MACLRQARAGFQAGPGGTEIVISVAERMVEEVDWPSYRVAMGPATTLGAALHALISSGNVDESSAAWNEIEEHVFSQGTIYSAAEPTVSVMLAALTSIVHGGVSDACCR